MIDWIGMPSYERQRHAKYHTGFFKTVSLSKTSVRETAMSDRCSFSTGALYPLESDHALSLLSDAGFIHAELMPQAFADVDEKAALRYEKTGIHIASIHYPLAMFSMLYSAHKSMATEGMRLSSDIVRLASRMQTEFIVIHPTATYSEEMKPIFEPKILQNITHLADLCQKQGITIAMENYPVGVGQYPETLQAYIASLKLPCVKPMVDTTEVCEGGGDPIAFLKAIAPYPCHLHLSDFMDGRKHLPAGEGAIDWKGVKAVLDAKKYPGYYTLEPSYRYYVTDIPTRLRKAYEFARRTFG